MIRNDQIGEKLHEWGPDLWVVQNIEIGDILPNGLAVSYRIDEETPKTLKEVIGFYDNGAVPYMKINKTLRDENLNLEELINRDSNTINFSEILKKEAGQCLEKAIAVQLYAQKGRESYLVLAGRLEQPGITTSLGHAYNIIKKDGKWFLVDAENPIIQNNRRIPYIIPIEGIDEKSKEIILPEKYGKDIGRRYYLQ